MNFIDGSMEIIRGDQVTADVACAAGNMMLSTAMADRRYCVMPSFLVTGYYVERMR
jgi:hypothetical protein